MPTEILERKRKAELISDEVTEIMSYRPHWVVRKGNTLFFVVALLLLLLTWVIHYPDAIKASARLKATDAPKLVVAKTEGKLEKLLVQNEQYVTEGQYLAYLQSTAKHEQVLVLKQWIDSMMAQVQQNHLNILLTQPLPDLVQLGELQAAYQAFQNVLIETEQLLRSGYYQQKRAALQKDLEYLAALKSRSYEQKNLLQQDQQLQKKEYEAYESLAKDKVIAPLELNQYKSKLLAKEQSVQQVEAQITNSDLSSHSKIKELMDLQKTMFDQQQTFHSALLELKSEVEQWMQQYIAMAPESGKVLYFSSLQENQLLASGQELFYIQPPQTTFYCELMAAQKGFGKVKPGQRVLIKVESYPSEEFGYLSGKVAYISNIPSRMDSFLVKVALPNGLQTNYNRKLFFRNNIAGSAEVITNNRRLLERLLGELKQVWER